MVSRRFAALLVAWLAFAASAAPACAALVQSDCCPAETCCIDADPGQAMPGATARVGDDQESDFDAPDTLIHTAWTAAAVPVAAAPGDRFDLAPANAQDGRGVYLRTGRLRL